MAAVVAVAGLLLMLLLVQREPVVAEMAVVVRLQPETVRPIPVAAVAAVRVMPGLEVQV